MYSTIYYKRNWGEKVSVSSRSYILSYLYCQVRDIKKSPPVSVSSRSYILSYVQEKHNLHKNILEFKVSVSSRSYILSYMTSWSTHRMYVSRQFPSPLGVIFSLIWLPEVRIECMFLDSFRLLSELYSLLYRDVIARSLKALKEFPSPLGVIFSLI